MWPIWALDMSNFGPCCVQLGGRPRQVIPDNAVVMGWPGRVVKIMHVTEAVPAAGAGAIQYRQNAARFRDSGIGLAGDTTSKL